MLKISLPYLLERCARKFPDKVGFMCEEGRWTIAQWNANANRRAGALAGLGVGRGGRVATLFANGRDVLETYPAVLKLGAALVPLNTRLSPDELRYQINHCQAETVIYQAQFQSVVDQVRAALPGVRTWLACGGEGGDGDLDQLLAAQSAADWPGPVAEDDLACILYTAGTTGRPKGVMLSHRNCLWAAVNLAQDSEFQERYRVLLVFPLYHSAAFSLLSTSLYLGCTLVSMARFDPLAVLETMARERVSKMAFPPTVWNHILQVPDLGRFDTASVESVSSGAEAMPLETKRKLAALFPNAKLGETYGMTETVAAIATLKPGQGPARQNCVGRAFTNLEIRVVDAEDQPLPAGQIGEVVVQGPNVMEGYLDDPAATQQTLRGGWLHTHDLGWLDEEGFLYLAGRQHDLIISGGENIYPREVEEVLYTHPAVADAAVIGLPDQMWGERVHAVIVLRAGCTLGEDEVIDFCRQHLASYKKPRSVEFVHTLPRSAAGKILKRELKERYR
ncbi:MAG: long-chain-fatty-acid--CoA ligase [Pseudomonadota bacterium]